MLLTIIDQSIRRNRNRPTRCPNAPPATSPCAHGFLDGAMDPTHTTRDVPSRAHLLKRRGRGLARVGGGGGPRTGRNSKSGGGQDLGVSDGRRCCTRCGDPFHLHPAKRASSLLLATLLPCTPAPPARPARAAVSPGSCRSSRIFPLADLDPFSGSSHARIVLMRECLALARLSPVLHVS